MKYKDKKHPEKKKGKIEVVKFLVTVADDKHPRDNNGWTPLDYAREKGHTEIINILEKY